MHRNSRFAPLLIAISVIAGIIIGTFFANRFSGNRLNIINTSSNKINDLLHIIDDQYVDTVNIADIVEQAMPKILAELDPHCSYISAEDAKTANDDLDGSFCGVGVQFSIKKDTVYITNIISGGPAEKVGLMAGDRIISVDDEPYVGKVVTNEETLHRLKGERDSQVKVGIVRRGEKAPLSFTITRGDIPIKSIDATYMLTDKLGYIRINKFGKTTYPELLISLAELEQENFKGLVIDLRGNTGGYLDCAIQLVNEFLPADKLIVYTEGRKSARQEYRSNGHGSYQKLPLIVLTDEGTASAAEIFSGAIQDNDRGIIVGRRSFGKGLVQKPMMFSDGSLIHLTVSRYYTPSGRCIQKPYVNGEDKEYEYDIANRYLHGEFFNEDSIRQTGDVYTTSIGRKVYGGGGIMPDYFVPMDTVSYTMMHRNLAAKGVINKTVSMYIDKHRKDLNRKYKDFEQFNTSYQIGNDVLDIMKQEAEKLKIEMKEDDYQKSLPLICTQLKALMARDLWDMSEYYQVMNTTNDSVLKALWILNESYERILSRNG